MTTRTKAGRIQDRPGELNTYACGCWIYRDSARAHFIEWCPLHSAAPELVAALEELCAYVQIDMVSDHDGGRYTPMMMRSRAALAKAGR